MSQIKHTEVLFIGGPADGRRLLVPDDIGSWKVAADIELHAVPYMRHEPIRIVMYKREYLYYDSKKRYSVFIDISHKKNVIEALIDGYKPSN